MTVDSKLKQTIAGLRNVQGTLRVYSSQVSEEESKGAYKEASEITGQVIVDLENRLKKLEFEEPQYKGN